MFKDDTTLDYYPIPRSFCPSAVYINYTSGGNITFSTDRIVCFTMKFSYEFTLYEVQYSKECSITSNTTINCNIPLINITTIEYSRIIFNLYYHDLNSPNSKTKLQQFFLYYTYNAKYLNQFSCNEFDNKCDNCGYCNGNNQCYSFNSSCDNILYNEPCNSLCDEDKIKTGENNDICCNIDLVDCYGNCNGSAEIVNITSSSDELTCCLFDCNNTCNGGAYIECDECIGGLTGNNSTMDCNGSCNGYGIKNECGYCVNISGLPLDYGIDCRGTCDSNLFINNCNVCDYMNYSYCKIEFKEAYFDHYIQMNQATRRIEYDFDIINTSNYSVIPYSYNTLSPYAENLRLSYLTKSYKPNEVIDTRLYISMKSGIQTVINNMNNVEYFSVTFKSDIYEVYEEQIHVFHYNNTGDCSKISNYILCNNIPGCYGCYYSDGMNSQINQHNDEYLFSCINYAGNGNPCFNPDAAYVFMNKYTILVYCVLFLSFFIF